VDQILDEFKFALEVVWYKAREEASGQVGYVVVVAAVVALLLWLLLSPGVRKKGY
jgi:hypothetical protein